MVICYKNIYHGFGIKKFAICYPELRLFLVMEIIC
jgi:hypothetical protein